MRAVDDVASSADPWIEAPLERGQVQYLNNHELSHYRSEFEDGDDPATKRHFYRLWHRSEGGVNYDGLGAAGGRPSRNLGNKKPLKLNGFRGNTSIP